MEPHSGTVKSAEISPVLSQLRLINTELEAIHSALRKYDPYSSTAFAWARQHTTDTLTIKTVKPADLKFCMDAEYLEPSVVLGFISEASTYKGLTNAEVRDFLEDFCE